MFRNHLHPITIFSCFVLGISALSLGIAFEILFEEWYRARRYGTGIFGSGDYSMSWEKLIALTSFLGIGAFLLTAALGLMFYKRWARYLMQFGFVLAALAWLAFMNYNFREFRSNPFVFSGITAMILGTIVGAMLFLNNTEWVLPHFQAYPDEHGTVLDQEFTQPNQTNV